MKDKHQFDEMMEDAVFSAATSEDGAEMLAGVITVSDVDQVGIMFDYIQTASGEDGNTTFAAELFIFYCYHSCRD